MEVPGQTVGGPEIMCEPCKQSHINHIATNYCTGCNEFLCVECTVVHQKFKILAGHTILDSTTMPKRKISLDSNELCQWHVDRHVEYYCCSHREKVCVICVGTRHQDCSNAVISFQDNCTKMSGTEDYLAFVEHITALEKQIVTLKDRLSSNGEDTNINAEKLVKDIEEFKVALIDAIDVLQTEAMQEVANARKAQHKLLCDLDTACNAVSTKVYVIKDDIERCVNFNKVQQFLAVFPLNKSLAEDITGDVDSLRKSIELVKYKFDPNSRLKGLKTLKRRFSEMVIKI